jgi:hypothetical protein
MINNRKSIFMLAHLLAAGWVHSQDQVILEDWLKKYPNHNAVMLRDDETVIIDIKKDSLLITQDVNTEILYLNDKAHFFNSGRVYYSYFSRLLDLEAKTLVPDKNNKYKTMKVEQFEETGETSASIFYDDSRSKSFVYPGLQKGARTVLSYKKQIVDPHLFTMFYFGAQFPVASSRLVVRAHRDVKLGYKMFNAEKVKVNYSTKVDGKFIEHIWEAKDVASYPNEPGTPSARYYLPHIVFYAESYVVKGKEIPVLRNLDDLYKWNYSFARETLKENDPAIKALTDSVIANAKTDAEKAKSIYYWVQEQIKYVAFEDGFRGFRPNSPSMVCNKRYGDCKDMASLMDGMMRMAGLKSYLVWIGSRDLPYKYTEIPTPIVDNHMIAAVELEKDSFIYLDATSRYTPFGMPSAFIMGKEALIAIDENNYKVRTVPVMGREKSMNIDSTTFTIEGKKITGKGKLVLTGYQKANNTYGLEGRRKEDLDKIMNEFLEKGNNKYKTVDYKISNVNDKDKPLVFDYSFTIEDYITTVGNELYINLVFDKHLMGATIDTAKYSLPRENDYPYTYRSVNSFDIPQGYTLEYLPKDARFDGDLFGYNISYTRTGSKVTVTSTVYVNYLLMTKEKFGEWNTMIKQLSNSYRESLILKKA